MRHVLTLGALLMLGWLLSGVQGLGSTSKVPSAANIAVAIVPDDTIVPAQPDLRPARDEAVHTLKQDLPAAWNHATRGLGILRVVEHGADVTIHLLAAKGTSVHVARRSRTEAIRIYVEDRHGVQGRQELVSTALHELGHIWCCRGPGTTDGHWIEAKGDEGLFGINRFGLMNAPVECKTLAGGTTLCPYEFSDREMVVL